MEDGNGENSSMEVDRDLTADEEPRLDLSTLRISEPTTAQSYDPSVAAAAHTNPADFQEIEQVVIDPAAPSTSYSRNPVRTITESFRRATSEYHGSIDGSTPDRRIRQPRRIYDDYMHESDGRTVRRSDRLNPILHPETVWVHSPVSGSNLLDLDFSSFGATINSFEASTSTSTGTGQGREHSFSEGVVGRRYSLASVLGSNLRDLPFGGGHTINTDPSTSAGTGRDPRVGTRIVGDVNLLSDDNLLIDVTTVTGGPDTSAETDPDATTGTRSGVDSPRHRRQARNSRPHRVTEETRRNQASPYRRGESTPRSKSV